jgi:CheY-like chemotaxis protein
MPKIVVVDDSKLMRTMLRGLLEQAGHEVEIWEDVIAMEIPERIGGTNPDLVITDYQMPGCNGLTLARMVKRTNPELPIVVLTATHDPSVVMSLTRQEVSCILFKPIKGEALLAAVSQALAQSL